VDIEYCYISGILLGYRPLLPVWMLKHRNNREIARSVRNVGEVDLIAVCDDLKKRGVYDAVGNGFDTYWHVCNMAFNAPKIVQPYADEVQRRAIERNGRQIGRQLHDGEIDIHVAAEKLRKLAEYSGDSYAGNVQSEKRREHGKDNTGKAGRVQGPYEKTRAERNSQSVHTPG